MPRSGASLGILGGLFLLAAGVPTRAGALENRGPVALDISGSCNADSTKLGLKLPEGGILEGIQFQWRKGPPDVVLFGLNEEGEAEFSAGGREVSQVFLAVHAKGKLLTFLPEALLYEVVYESGRCERHAPFNVTTGSYKLVFDRLCLYLVNTETTSPVKTIRLVKRYPFCELVICGLTVSSERLKNVDPPKSYQKLTVTGPAVEVQATGPSAEKSDEAVTIQNAHYLVEFSQVPAFGISRLENKVTGISYFGGKAARLFTVLAGDKLLSGRDFTVSSAAVEKTAQGSSVIFTLESSRADVPVRATVRVEADQGHEMIFHLTFTNASSAPLKLAAGFPILEGIELGPDATYYFPMYQGFLSHAPLRMDHSYNGVMHVGVMDAFDSGGGGGLSVRVVDTEPVYKDLQLIKPALSGETPSAEYGRSPTRGHSESEPGKVTLGVHYPARDVAPGGTLELPAAALGIHQGDWRVAVSDYLRWVKTWYREPERPEWIYRIGVLARMWRSQWDRVYPAKKYFGDYDHWDLHQITKWTDYDLQLSDFKQDFSHLPPWGDRPLVDECHRKRHTAGIYSEAVSVNDSGKPKFNKDWVTRNPQGEPQMFYPQWGGWGMCLWLAGWQEAFCGTAEQVIEHLNLDGFYLDEIGRSNHQCFASSDGHPTSDCSPKGNVLFAGYAYSALHRLKPNLMLYAEGPGTDVMTQYIDACYAYGAQGIGNDPLQHVPSNAHLLRFMFPKLKMFLMNNVGCSVGALKTALFNGEAYTLDTSGWIRNLEGREAPELYEYANRALGHIVPILRENWDAFHSKEISPLVDLGQKATYVNCFPAGEKTIYTIFNPECVSARDNYQLPWKVDYHLVDLYEGEEIPLKQAQALVEATLETDPKDVRVLLYAKKVIKAEIVGDAVEVKVAAIDGARTVLRVSHEGSWESIDVEVTGPMIRIPLERIGAAARQRVFIKLIRDGLLADLEVLRT